MQITYSIFPMLKKYTILHSSIRYNNPPIHIHLTSQVIILRQKKSIFNHLCINVGILINNGLEYKRIIIVSVWIYLQWNIQNKASSIFYFQLANRWTDCWNWVIFLRLKIIPIPTEFSAVAENSLGTYCLLLDDSINNYACINNRTGIGSNSGNRQCHSMVDIKIIYIITIISS